MPSLKIVLFGEASTGKTQLWRRLSDMPSNSTPLNFNPAYRSATGSTPLNFNPAYQSTKGVDFVMKPHEGTTLQIWDTAGEPRFLGITKPFFRGTDVGFYCISLTDELNPQKISDDLALFRKEAGETVPIILIGTKVDVEEQERKISDDQFNLLLSNENYNFQGGIKISSKTDAGLVDLLKLIPKDLLEKEKIEQPSFATSSQGFYNHAEKRTENTNDTICGMPSWLFWTCLAIVGPGWVVGLFIAVGISIYNCCTNIDVVENENVATYHT